MIAGFGERYVQQWLQEAWLHTLESWHWKQHIRRKDCVSFSASCWKFLRVEVVYKANVVSIGRMSHTSLAPANGSRRIIGNPMTPDQEHAAQRWLYQITLSDWRKQEPWWSIDEEYKNFLRRIVQCDVKIFKGQDNLQKHNFWSFKLSGKFWTF